jgi:hypothetical protein
MIWFTPHHKQTSAAVKWAQFISVNYFMFVLETNQLWVFFELVMFNNSEIQYWTIYWELLEESFHILRTSLGVRMAYLRNILSCVLVTKDTGLEQRVNLLNIH